MISDAKIVDDGTISIQPSGDTTDYLTVSTATNIVTITTVGGTDGDLVITAAGGDISFGNENLVTTGTLGAGATTLGGTLILGAQNITMTGSLAATAARVTKGWFTDIESTNLPTVGGLALSPTNVTPVDAGDANAPYYPVLMDGLTLTQVAMTDAGMSYNPSTNTLTASAFTGTASLATTVTVTDDENTADDHEVVFTTDNANLESDGTFNYNPSTGTVNTTIIAATGAIGGAKITGTSMDVTSGGITNVGNIADDAAFSVISTRPTCLY